MSSTLPVLLSIVEHLSCTLLDLPKANRRVVCTCTLKHTCRIVEPCKCTTRQLLSELIESVHLRGSEQTQSCLEPIIFSEFLLFPGVLVWVIMAQRHSMTLHSAHGVKDSEANEASSSMQATCCLWVVFTHMNCSCKVAERRSMAHHRLHP